MKFERQVKKLELNVDLNNSFFVRGDMILSFAETPDDKLLVPLYDSKQLLVLQDWEVLQTIYHKIRDFRVAKHSLLPKFTWQLFSFMLYDNEILNLKTLSKDSFIKGGIPNFSIKTPSHFFVDGGDGRFELHFCVTSENIANSNKEHVWYCLDLNQDFW